MNTAVLASIHIYPIKSAQAQHVLTARAAHLGLQGDRRWMIVDAEGRFLSQRERPELASIAVQWGGASLSLSHHGLPPITVPRIPYPALHDVRVWQRVVEAVDQGDEAAVWISALCREALRLVAIPPELEELPGQHKTAFADGSPVLVTNEASRQALNKRLVEEGHEPVPMDRFRPNLVLRGLPAFAEDRIESLRIGQVLLRFDKACARCKVVNTDQNSGEVYKQPLKTLAKMRNNVAGKGITFGWNTSITEGFGERLAVGDEVEINWRED